MTFILAVGHGIWTRVLVSAYVWALIEIMFYAMFRWYILPKANEIQAPPEYRDYGRDRHKLLQRITERIDRTCRLTKADAKQALRQMLSDWFRTTKNPSFAQYTTPEASALSSPDNSDDDDDSSDDDDDYDVDNHIAKYRSRNRLPSRLTPSGCLYKEDMDIFFSWAFFGKRVTDLKDWEVEEHNRLFQHLEDNHGVSFPRKSIATTKQQTSFYYQRNARCMTLETVTSIHRLLLVYIAVYVIQLLGAVVLLFLGYRRCVASNGLVAWHRPAKNKNGGFLPMLFFHGIAPSGLTLYLPFVLSALACEPDRPIFLFENPAISCSVDIKLAPLAEQGTVTGVFEILTRFNYAKSKLSLVGHSFGSCPITWLLAAQEELGLNIRQVALLDPVTILLSEPNIMVNFLYSQRMSKIRMLASSELFTQHYLRRHFAWYNTELWLDRHIPDKEKCQILVCLAEEDEIINARRVKEEVLQHSELSSQLVFWEKAGHGGCVTSPKKWKQIKNTMLLQELKIAEEESH